LNQGILEELQKLGYPVFSQSLLPLDPGLLDRLFGAEVRAGYITSPLDISDVWKNTFSASSNHKIWAAKFAARHPNLISVELSNFKCGHDAFISRTIEEIIEQSGKPHFSFRDLDENRPLASIRIRVETMHYFLKDYRRRLQAGTLCQITPSRSPGHPSKRIECNYSGWSSPIPAEFAACVQKNCAKALTHPCRF
jgi:predicted nucleotide-binding protein (sugar kinase/HSP70/actin superfamily)